MRFDLGQGPRAHTNSLGPPTSMSGVSDGARRAPKHPKAGSRKSNAGAKGSLGGILPSVDRRSGWPTHADEERKDARARVNAKA
jgi:hypothetical protein